MPELPELEVTKDRLRLALAGRVAAGATVRSPVVLKTVMPPLESLTGKHIRSVSRLGKVICIAFDGSAGSSPPPPTTSSFPLSTSPLPSLTLSAEFTLARFRQALGRRSRTLKRFLTDQSAIAGIGNCFSDEILFEARLSPFALSTTIRPEEAIRLYMATKKVLQDAILHLRALDRLPERKDRTFLRIHDRLDQPCPACATPVKRVSFQKSTLYYCPTCQTGGRELADRRFSKFLK